MLSAWQQLEPLQKPMSDIMDAAPIVIYSLCPTHTAIQIQSSDRQQLAQLSSISIMPACLIVDPFHLSFLLSSQKCIKYV